ncbi:hypothetical protein VR44_29260 [Streptomyces katrae]|uniref:Uncharacterized protein n=1 Tax=Streptomyces katrae TaxID=68223 RepID=A0A0F4IXN0_9ACTN|nr:hypothetical protein VR44_29260 [Streptomyces katrae]
MDGAGRADPRSAAKALRGSLGSLGPGAQDFEGTLMPAVDLVARMVVDGRLVAGVHPHAGALAVGDDIEWLFVGVSVLGGIRDDRESPTSSINSRR